MTQAKKASKSPKKAVKMAIMPSMAEKYRNLPQTQQESIITFFNLHNASTFVFNQMSADAQEYCRYCIEMSMDQGKDVTEENNA